jgi:hypothetical protein
VLRISIDAKATVKVGPFARGGKSRVPTLAVDHDFQPAALLTPVGIVLPALDELFVYGITSKVTSDCLADCVERWCERVRSRFAQITMLVINLDNGPENHSRRTQFMQRMVTFAQRTGLTIRLAYENALSQQVQSDRTLLRRSGNALEWRPARLDQHGHAVGRDHGLERNPSGGGIDYHHLQDRRQVNQSRHASG